MFSRAALAALAVAALAARLACARLGSPSTSVAPLSAPAPPPAPAPPAPAPLAPAPVPAPSPCALFCGGALLEAVQTVEPHLFVDSKSFVDMPLRAPHTPAGVEAKYAALAAALAPAPVPRAALADFVGEHFLPPGSDLDVCAPPDWTAATPPLFASLQNQTIAAFLTAAVHGAWPSLTRCTRVDAAAPDRHTLLDQPHPVVVPGGRFRESYAWDGLFIIEGLVASGMHATARGLVANAAHLMASTGGFLPNGGRSYYSTPGRSQPPVFLAAVFAIADAAPGGADAAFVGAHYETAAREHAWWAATHAVRVLDARGGAHTLSRYVTRGQTGPRVEAYREDAATAARAGHARGSPAAARLFADIASAAESGWDFSSRWLGDGLTLETADTSAVVPADLNAFLLVFERLLARAAALTGRGAAAAAWAAAADAREAAIDAVLFDAPAAQWRDARLVGGAGDEADGAAPRRVTLSAAAAASNYIPLWAGVARGDAPRVARIAAALRGSGLLARGGVVATTARTGEQWDSPNAWPVVQRLLVGGLAGAGEASAAALARDLARRWLAATHAGWQRSGEMDEKMNAEDGGAGAGGEYVPQVGFGASGRGARGGGAGPAGDAGANSTPLPPSRRAQAGRTA